ncbi:MAG: diaminopimelate epimerase [SAR202 cluster bacterium]|nr:diaminopimelate epimerase [SAR202 cluster bacterium]
MKFTKMHGAGNDYVYVDGRGLKQDWPEVSRRVSDRHFGIGSDGLILALPSDKADVRMQMFNADGSEGEMCGNGIRCLVSFALENGIVGKRNGGVSVETLAGVLDVTPIFDNGRMTRARVSMGLPRFEAKDIPVNLPGQSKVVDYPLKVDGHTFKISCVSMGNPHAVAFLDTPVDELPLERLGPLVENHPMFPRRVNFEVVNVLSRDHIKIRVWERGSGITLACGTGACAAAVIARQQGRVDDGVTVTLPGGDLKVRWPGEGQVILEGPVEKVFEGEWAG